MMTIKPGSTKLESIQILRAVAAIMVIVHHFSSSFDEFSSSTPFISSSGLGKIGAAGVDVFFVISGFIMFFTQKENDTLSPQSRARQFIIRRVKRIYPTYWFWSTILLILWLSSYALKSHEFSIGYIISSYLLVPTNLQQAIWHPFLDQGWTLAYEMYFYLVFAGSFFIKSKIPKGFLIAIAFATISMLSQFALDKGAILNFLKDEIIIEFLFGAAIAYIVRRSNFLSTRIAIICQVVGYLLLFSNLLGELEYRVLQFGFPAFLIVLGTSLRKPDSRSYPVYYQILVYLGNASYSIYLTHGLFTMTSGALLKKNLLTNVQPDLAIILGTILAVTFGTLSYTLIEKPLIKLVDFKKTSLKQRPQILS